MTGWSCRKITASFVSGTKQKGRDLLQSVTVYQRSQLPICLVSLWRDEAHKRWVEVATESLIRRQPMYIAKPLNATKHTAQPRSHIYTFISTQPVSSPKPINLLARLSNSHGFTKTIKNSPPVQSLPQQYPARYRYPMQSSEPPESGSLRLRY